MSDEHPQAPGPPDDDPFAFEPDERDAPSSPDERADDAPRAADAAAPGGEGGGGAAGPRPEVPARRRRRGSRAARRTDEESARIRTVAEDASRHAQAVGVRWLAVAGIVLVVLAGVTTFTGRDAEVGGDVRAGETLPPFAAPLATRPELKDNDFVNVADADGQGERGKRAACSITSPSAITSCALLRRGPLVLVIFSRGIDECVSAVDEIDRVRTRYPALQTLAVATLGRHGPTSETVRDRRWTLPVAYDRDAGLSTLLGAPACPLVLFVRRDGTVAQRIIGRLRPEALTRGIDELLRPAPAPATATVDAAPPGR